MVTMGRFPRTKIPVVRKNLLEFRNTVIIINRTLIIYHVLNLRHRYTHVSTVHGVGNDIHVHVCVTIVDNLPFLQQVMSTVMYKHIDRYQYHLASCTCKSLSVY